MSYLVLYYTHANSADNTFFHLFHFTKSVFKTQTPFAHFTIQLHNVQTAFTISYSIFFLRQVRLCFRTFF